MTAREQSECEVLGRALADEAGNPSRDRGRVEAMERSLADCDLLSPTKSVTWSCGATQFVLVDLQMETLGSHGHKKTCLIPACTRT